VTGGRKRTSVSFNSAELYDIPQVGTFVPTGKRERHPLLPAPAVLLTNGKVLFTGLRVFPFGSTAELYDPSSGTFCF